MINHEMAKRYYLKGMESGYPVCCIEQFIIDINNGLTPTSKRLGLDGYVPCEQCEKEILEQIDKRVNILLKDNIGEKLTDMAGEKP